MMPKPMPTVAVTPAAKPPSSWRRLPAAVSRVYDEITIPLSTSTPPPRWISVTVSPKSSQAKSTALGLYRQSMITISPTPSRLMAARKSVSASAMPITADTARRVHSAGVRSVKVVHSPGASASKPANRTSATTFLNRFNASGVTCAPLQR